MSLLILPLMLWMGVYTFDQVIHQSPKAVEQMQEMHTDTKNPNENPAKK